jgi:hypothetical protein
VDLATVLVAGMKAYLAVGAGFAVWFAVRGAKRLDSAGRAGTIGFRILLLPGATLLWPALLARLRRPFPTAGPPAGAGPARIGR